MRSVYVCQFNGCIFKTGTIAALKRHQEICYSNPTRKACKTCEAWDFDEQGRYCRKDLLGDKQSTFNCEGWEC